MTTIPNSTCDSEIPEYVLQKTHCHLMAKQLHTGNHTMTEEITNS